MNLKIIPFLLFSVGTFAQQIGDFISLPPEAQTTDFIIPSTHRFQKIIEGGDPLTEGGELLLKNDFTAYVPIDGSNENGYLSINAEAIPGGVSILDINYNTTARIWETTRSEAVDFSGVFATVANCSGTLTPWGTIISCEEWTSKDLQNDARFPYEGNTDFNNDGYDDFGWAIEIDPVTKTVIDQPGGLNGPDKLWALGNFKHENIVIHTNERTAYQGVDSGTGYLYKFVADNPQDLSSGNLYVYQGSKNGSGIWIQIKNTTQAEQNSTLAQSAAVGGTVFAGIEDVEIGPDGLVYFAVKSENQVYRFQDSDPISGTVVPLMETFVGNATYTITHENGTSAVDWGGGNDNLAFDNQGNLWVNQDANDLQNYVWVVENGHTQSNPKVKIFGNTPKGSESTGITFSPDNQYMFMSFQHPNANNNSSTQIDAAGVAVAFDKSITVVISLVNPPDQTWYLDADLDGFANSNTVQSPTTPGSGYTTNVIPTTDCNDQDATINPDTTWYLDADVDGFAAPTTMQSCESPGVGYVMTMLPTTDCNDSDAAVNAIRTWYLDADDDGFAVSIMENCNSPGTGYTNEVLPLTDCNDSDASVNAITTWYLDADNDGFAVSTTESCNSPGTGYTNEVLPLTDCSDSNASVNAITTWYLDSDNDGFAVSTLESCESPGTGYTNEVLSLTDCNDSDAAVNAITTWYLDADDDGFGISTMESCDSPGTGYTNEILPLTDCNDSDASVNVLATWYLDADNDGFAVSTMESCDSPGIGYTMSVLPTADCDDTDAAATIETLWYLDANEDGFADDVPISSCESPGDGYSKNMLPLQSELIEDGSIFYPNPTIAEVFMVLDKSYTELLVKISTSNGREVLEKKVSNTDKITIDLIGQQSGVYFIQLINEGERVDFFKVVIL